MDKNVCLFRTKIGKCGLVWFENEIIEMRLPESSSQMLQKKVKSKTYQISPLSKAPQWIKNIIKKIQLHLQGIPQDFSSATLSTRQFSQFQIHVYQAIQKIPSGKFITYKEVGLAMGGTKAYRAIGTALGKNPIPLLIPCHRVIGSNSKLGGFSAPGGLKTKIKLLTIEGVSL